MQNFKVLIYLAATILWKANGDTAINRIDGSNDRIEIREYNSLGDPRFMTQLVNKQAEKVSGELEHMTPKMRGCRILRGSRIPHNWYPWLVSIKCSTIRSGFKALSHCCTGSIIAPKIVLTAAHCLLDESLYPKMVIVGYGSSHLGAMRHKFVTHFTIPNSSYGRSDIGLLLVDSEFLDYGKSVKPVCLQTDYSNLLGKALHIAGWGTTEREEQPLLLHGSVMLNIDSFSCPDDPLANDANSPDYETLEYEGEFCIENSWSAPYYGDSGGPLMYQNPDSGRFEVLAVVSQCTSCHYPENPRFYTQLQRYKAWIKERVPEACFA